MTDTPTSLADTLDRALADANPDDPLVLYKPTLQGLSERMRQLGGSQPVTRAQYEGNEVTVADSGFTYLTWDTKLSGDDLLDLSTPDAPSVIEAGVYAVTVRGEQDGSFTATGYWTQYLEMDADGEDATTASDAPIGVLHADVSVTMVYYVPAGGTIKAAVLNHDGVASRNFNLEAFVQRLS